MKKAHVAFAVLACVIAGALGQRYPTDEWVTVANGVEQPENTLIFYEEFNELNPDIWQHEITLNGNGNGEFQIYWNNRSNSYTKEGILYIKPGLTTDAFGSDDYLWTGYVDLNGATPYDQCTNAMWPGCSIVGSADSYINPTTSARIRTLNSFAFKYGKVEIRAKMPRGDWLWPALWMLPKHNSYSGWPASGEIDICESRGNRDYDDWGIQLGEQQVSQTLHFGPFWQLKNDWQNSHFEANNPAGFGADFHLYGIDWTPDYIALSVDGVTTGTVAPTAEEGFWGVYPFEDEVEAIDLPWDPEKGATKMAPFDKEFYLVINVAVGGTGGFFQDGVGNKPWSNQRPSTAFKDFWEARDQWLPTWQGEDAALQVDYVKVWSL